MIKGIIILACCLPLAVSATENQAITDTNFQADLAYSTSEYFDHVILSGIVNLPISDNLGASLGAIASNTNGKTVNGGRGIDSKLYGLNALVFVRNQNMGRLGLGYALAHSENDESNSSSFPDERDIHGYRLLGEYYLDTITLTGSRNYSADDDDNEFFSSTLAVAWYVQDNIRLNIARLMHQDQYDSIILLELQPALMNNAMSISLAYEKDSDDSDFDTYGISVSYFFGTRVSLIDRDRKYR